MPKKDTSIKARLAWLDNNLLAILAGLLLIVVPLYPKIPLVDILPGYIVRVRPEDFLILFVGLAWLVQVVRKKVRWKSRISVWIGAYLLVGLLSSISAIYVTKTVPNESLHVGKLFLHYFRRIEYFSLFFIFFAAIKNELQARRLIYLLFPITLIITLYGFGQKYLYWPVYSTMNREFSKGIRLYLTEHARVPSTFGGHYDAAAFTMMALAIVLSISLLAAKKTSKWLGAGIFVLGYWLLILTGSRTSIIAYAVAISVLFVVTTLLKSRTIKWALSHWLVIIVVSLSIMSTSDDLTERFDQVFRLERHMDKIKSSFLERFVSKPEDGISMEELESQVIARSDQQPVVQPPATRKLPPDVYEDIPENPEEVATGAAEPIARTWSENADKYGLSVAIRLDALWPRAIAGFMSNPLLGSGYSTLTKESVEVFTEAESTDNDYLRTLGETGALGFITFYGIVLLLIWRTYLHINTKDEALFTAYRIGFIAASVGLLVNALYIDVFESSKVVETYWALAGLTMAIGVIHKRELVSFEKYALSAKKRRKKKSLKATS